MCECVYERERGKERESERERERDRERQRWEVREVGNEIDSKKFSNESSTKIIVTKLLVYFDLKESIHCNTKSI